MKKNVFQHFSLKEQIYKIQQIQAAELTLPSNGQNLSSSKVILRSISNIITEASF